MGKSYEKEYELHYYDVDKNLKANMSMIINILSDIGTKQSEELGSGMESLIENNMTWVFYNYHVKIVRNPMYKEKLTVKTEPVGFKKFYALRNYEIKDSNGNVIVTANAIFLLINLEKRRMMRIPKEQYDVYGVEGDIKEEFKIPRLETITEYKYEDTFKVRYSDIDSNQHVNNTKYIDWAIETLPEEIVDNYTLDEIKVTFEKECKYGETVRVLTDVREEDEAIVTIHKIETLDNKQLTKLIGCWKKV
ncbi:acyl-[acyl-carrier-protein] thioesterase [Clostridium sp. Sa3CUN1]|uniref:Acyl-[acyl-carrier-protein] thioesterase n=1 Tax=Clostridium gallinarum TaxID=2762246 RepID=A0ABR8Q724_9CLOT|nr:acyl-ACP thioesterase domain-containing protein [Clostridium gallinarum]MBD7916237.1 acyl-[acyl-carrier-protein] thioesterase [Clostridium gallinarum]